MKKRHDGHAIYCVYEYSIFDLYTIYKYLYISLLILNHIEWAHKRTLYPGISIIAFVGK